MYVIYIHMFTVTYVLPFTLWLLNCMIVKSSTAYLQVQFTSYLRTPTMQCVMEESGTNGLGTEKHLKKAVTQKAGGSQRRYGTGRRGHIPSTQQNISLSQKPIALWRTQPQRIPAFLWSEYKCIILHEHSVQYLLLSMLLLKIKPTRSSPVNKICMSQIRASNFPLWITCVFSIIPYWQNLQLLFLSKRKCVQSVYFHWPELPLIQGKSNAKQRSCVIHSLAGSSQMG